MKAGWCLALAYLFCVLAPSLSFAFATEAMAAPCIIEDHGPAMDMGAGTHLHGGGLVHDHSHHASAASEHTKIHPDAGAPAEHSHKGPDNRCCNLVFASAIPAPEIIISTPVAACSRCVILLTGVLADNAPPARYRPPIS